MAEKRQQNQVFEGGPNLPEAVKQHMAAVGADPGSQGPYRSPTPPADAPEGHTQSIDQMLAETFGVKIAHELVPLPSEGKVYPVGHPFHGKDRVEITAMTAKEEDILTSRALLKKGTAVTELIRSCLVDKRVDPADLLVGDRNALLMAIRITGYGPSYDAELECSDCGEKAPRHFDLTQLPVRTLKIKPVKEGQNLFEFKLPNLGVKVHFKFLTGREEEDTMATQEKQKKLGLTQGDSIVTTSLMSTIVSANGVDDKSKLIHLVRRLPAADSNALREYIRDNEPTVVMKQEVECPLCGHWEGVQMPMGVKFLWPNAG